MDQLTTADRLFVHQTIEWAEAFTNWETRNRYVIVDENNRELFHAAEVAGSAIVRVFLKAWRPFQIVVADENGVALKIDRPLRCYFHEIALLDDTGRTVGSVKRRFSIFNRVYDVMDSQGRVLFELDGPLFRPWTFRILSNGQEIGLIQKKWSGLGNELFTDADRFGVSFPSSLATTEKAMLLGAVFLIDFVHFEDTGS